MDYQPAGDPAVGLIPQALLNTVCLPFESPAFNDFNNHQSESTSNTSGTVKAVYRWSPELLTYLSYAKGFKAGGFNLDRVGCPNGQPCHRDRRSRRQLPAPSTRSPPMA